MGIPEIGAVVMLGLPNQPGWNRAESRVLRIDIGPVGLWAGTDQTHLTYHTRYGPIGLVGRRFYCALTVGITVGLTWVHARPVTVFRRRPDQARHWLRFGRLSRSSGFVRSQTTGGLLWSS